ncbi:MAG: hypothetical protein ACO3CC_15355 [Alphaproteobacteria bacterium]
MSFHRVFRPGPLLRPVVAAVALVAALAGCAPESGEPDWIDRLSGLSRDGKPVPQPPAVEGRPYPNLASVPTRAPRPVVAARDARDAARRAAEQRREALAEGRPAGAGSAPAGSRMGVVVPDEIGAFSREDEEVLGRAVGLAAQGPGRRIRLSGEARAALATADRLSRLGFDRGRIDLVPSPETRGERKAVEITVAGSAPGR